MKPQAGSSIAVFGVGAVGLAALAAAKVAGCATMIAVDVHEGRLELAKELGASHVVNASAVDPVEEIRRMTGGGVNYAVEAAGRPAVIVQAVEALRPIGVCVLLGVAPPGSQVTFNVSALRRGVSVRSSTEGDAVPDVFIPQMVSLYRKGDFPFDKMIKFYDLAEINQAVADSESGKVVKPVLRMPV